MQPHPLTASKKIFTITEITQDLKELIEDNFHSVWLKGEISNFKSYASGHFYFTLKDENAQISAVMFKGYNRLLKFELEDGMSVIVHGRLTIYEVRGQYQIRVDHVEPEGIGALQLAFDQLKEKLKKEGLFDEDRKRPLPALPEKVGIVTSLHGAAIHDMVTILKRRFPNVHIIVYPVKVQGAGSAEEIVSAIHSFSHKKNVDVLIVGRGGGSLEDLWSFNEEDVVRAIASCPIPVISAVGHETDFSMADFVADIRAPTPSAAAELCVPVKAEMLSNIHQLKNRLIIAMQNKIRHDKKHLAYLLKSLPTPQTILDRLLLKLADYQNRVSQAIILRIREEQWNLAQTQKNLTTLTEKYFIAVKHKLENYQIKIHLLSPKNILKRGYVIAKTTQGNIITRKKHVQSGDELGLTFFDGNIRSIVK